MNLSTFSENQLVHILGEIRNPTDGPTGWLEVTSDELPIDKKLLDALPAHAQSWPFDGSEGNIGFKYELSREVPGGPSISGCSFTPAAAGCATINFPMRFRMFMRDGDDRRKLVVSQPGRLQRHDPLNGEARSPHVHGRRTGVAAQRRGVPLEGELRDALQPACGRSGHAAAAGTIDITATSATSTSSTADVAVRAEPQSEPVRWSVQFPYAWKTCKASSPMTAGG